MTKETPLTIFSNIHNQATYPDVIVIPIHSDERAKLAELSLYAIAKQEKFETTVVVADNGMSETAARNIQEYGESLNLAVRISNAHPENSSQKSAAYARNMAISQIYSLASENPRLRGNIMLVDSDTYLHPNAISYLKNTYEHLGNASAVIPHIIPVNELYRENPEDNNKFFQKNTIKEPRQYPNLITGQHVDLSMVIAFSGDVATKTAGLYLDRDTVTDLFEKKGGRIFEQMPYGSAEDMLLSLDLTKNGKMIFGEPKAQILDEARATLSAVCKQRLQWGADHVYMAHFLTKQGRMERGIKVLEPSGDKWSEWIIPGTELSNGTIINPKQIKKIKDSLDSINFSQLEPLLQLSCTEKLLQAWFKRIDSMINYLDKVRPSQFIKIRDDLPACIDKPDTTLVRWSEASRQGQLLGNIVGMQELSDKGCSDIFVLGVRQAASWI